MREEGRTVWATDLAQGAVVLAPGAAWLGDTPASLPEKLALVIGTESTGVSQFILDDADRRVYLPQNGFADSYNVSVAAALALHAVIEAYGPAACGDLCRAGGADARGAPPAPSRCSARAASSSRWSSRSEESSVRTWRFVSQSAKTRSMYSFERWRRRSSAACDHGPSSTAPCELPCGRGGGRAGEPNARARARG